VSARRLYLDRSPGERRAVVLLDGRPERFLIERDDEPERARLGEVRRGRIRAVAKGFTGAFVDLGLERDGLMKAEQGLAEGAIIEVEVVAEARADKGPSLRFVGRSEGVAGLITPAPGIEERLRAYAPSTPVVEGETAREIADQTFEAILATRHVPRRDVTLAIERTRAMVAIDVDLGDAAASRKNILDANLAAVREIARLLRLKALGGLAVIDLAGPAREHEPILNAARQAFAPDEPGVVLAGPSRLGVLEVAKPWRERPVAEALLDRDGRMSSRSVAHDLIRALEREGRGDPGSLLVGVCSPDVAEVAVRWVGELGPRFSVAAEVGRDRLSTDIKRT
jgi:Ribonuclease G/E